MSVDIANPFAAELLDTLSVLAPPTVAVKESGGRTVVSVKWAAYRGVELEIVDTRVDVTFGSYMGMGTVAKDARTSTISEIADFVVYTIRRMNRSLFQGEDELAGRAL